MSFVSRRTARHPSMSKKRSKSSTSLESFKSGPFDPSFPAKLDSRSSNPHAGIGVKQLPQGTPVPTTAPKPKGRLRPVASTDSAADDSEFLRMGTKVKGKPRPSSLSLSSLKA